MGPSPTHPWWKTSVIYQIYPRSFKDSNGDGIGDLQGIIEKLDYLNDGTERSLGVDALWISPIYPSSMKDFGYDISDYQDIDALFGSLDDFKTLLEAAHKRGIKIIMDLVINHTSDEHPWFVEAKQNLDNPRRDWYLWQTQKPNNWFSYFEMHSAWWQEKQTGTYYLGTFTKNQPEVNWRNPDLKEAMYNVIKFWFDLGVDGFRMDVVNWYIKDHNLRSNPWKLALHPPQIQKHIYDRNQPETHAICKEMRHIADTYDGDKVLIGEIYTNDSQEAVSYHGRNDELHMAFNFNFLFQKWSAKAFYDSISAWYKALSDDNWPNFTLSNHDQPRHYYRYKKGHETLPRAKVAAAMMMTLRGTPFIYYGEEIGMTNRRIKKSQLQDPLGIKGWPIIKGRDGERTPMQWNASPYAGFSSSNPWLPVHENYMNKNVTRQSEDPTSLLSFYRKIIWLRKNTTCLTSGSISFITTNPKNMLIYKRMYNEETCMILLNFSSKTIPIPYIIEGDYVNLLGTHIEENQPVDWHERAIMPYEIIIAKKIRQHL